jgi:Na+/melibiose symporter-like transporter
VLPENVRRVLGKLWPYSLSVTVICFLIALGIAIFGFAPRATDPDSVLVICWSFLGAAWVLMLFTLVCGFAYDIQRQTDNKED